MPVSPQELRELESAGVISPETADAIRSYYLEKETADTGSRTLLIFGVLGAFLVGLGVVLVVAHNWDQLPRFWKTVLASLPMVIGQLACAYALMRDTLDRVWREGAAIFLFFGVGATISLVSQIYHIPGALPEFVLTWMLVALPLVYVMPASVVGLMYLCGITYYALELGSLGYQRRLPWLYLPLLLAIVPHLVQLYRQQKRSNLISYYGFAIALSLLAVLGVFSTSFEPILVLAYGALLGTMYRAGDLLNKSAGSDRVHVLSFIGGLGTAIIWLALTFEGVWQEMDVSPTIWARFWTVPECWSSLFLFGVWFYLARLQARNARLERSPLQLAPLLLLGVFVVGQYSPELAAIMSNLGLLGASVYYVWLGMRRNHLGITNGGLLLLLFLAGIRFFDESLSFALRGGLFLLVGLGFFATNYFLIRKKRQLHDQ